MEPTIKQKPQVLLLLTAMAVFAAPRLAEAGCEGPSIESEEASVAAGLTVTGQAWIEGCDDSQGEGACGRPIGGEREEPMQDIPIFVDARLVATVDADDEGAFTASIPVPNLRPGRHEIRAGAAGPEQAVGPILIERR